MESHRFIGVRRNVVGIDFDGRRTLHLGFIAANGIATPLWNEVGFVKPLTRPSGACDHQCTVRLWHATPYYGLMARVDAILVSYDHE